MEKINQQAPFPQTAMSEAAALSKRTTRGRWKLFSVLAVCAAPMLLSYLAYYVIKPQGRTNYGELLDPRAHPMPVLQAHEQGAPERGVVGLEAFRGKWLMLTVDSGACATACEKKLYDVRQLRLVQGKEMDRIERIWLVDDAQTVAPRLLNEFAGMHALTVDAAQLRSWLPVAEGGQLSEHIYLVDPLGNLMMRYPKDADPNKIKKDLAKLLRASAIG
ncbi:MULTISPECIES: cytochrome C oxidase subunit I [unclassified Undibacterium]|uniref:SCO family protein n=2 Tax=unclassified Undibacterium TaxID=2630295 RepID=UPI002AC9C8A2|nr:MULTISPECIES: cytochrome C oxidase subunit I [unclassified Undibacterium]WPX45087.1 cytochrome C oxidase subunit I [Undibacterium sp. CCC3.4]